MAPDYTLDHLLELFSLLSASISMDSLENRLVLSNKSVTMYLYIK